MKNSHRWWDKIVGRRVPALSAWQSPAPAEDAGCDRAGFIISYRENCYIIDKQISMICGSQKSSVKSLDFGVKSLQKPTCFGGIDDDFFSKTHLVSWKKHIFVAEKLSLDSQRTVWRCSVVCWSQKYPSNRILRLMGILRLAGGRVSIRMTDNNYELYDKKIRIWLKNKRRK